MEKKAVKLFTNSAEPLDLQINKWMEAAEKKEQAEVVDIKLVSSDTGVLNALVLYTYEEE